MTGACENRRADCAFADREGAGNAQARPQAEPENKRTELRQYRIILRADAASERCKLLSKKRR